MSAPRAWTVIFPIALRAVLKAMTAVAGSRSQGRRIFRPEGFGFCALALLVVLWGFHYKLSLYQLHSSPCQQGVVAKLWIEPPNAALRAVEKLRKQSHAAQYPTALEGAQLSLSHVQRSLVPVAQEQCRTCLLLEFPTPLRSPPSQETPVA